MLRVKKICNNGGLLTLQLLGTPSTRVIREGVKYFDPEDNEISEDEYRNGLMNSDDSSFKKFYYRVEADGVVQFGAYENCEWDSSNANVINQIFGLKDTENEIAESCAVSVNRLPVGLLRKTFQELDLRYAIMEKFKQMENEDSWVNECLAKLHRM